MSAILQNGLLRFYQVPSLSWVSLRFNDESQGNGLSQGSSCPCNPWETHLILSIIQINTLRPRQHGRHFPDDSFKWIFLNENVWISIEVSLKFIPNGPINNITALVQIMAWRRPGDKPLSEPMMVNLPTHICITQPQWVNSSPLGQNGRHFGSQHIQTHFCEWKY